MYICMHVCMYICMHVCVTHKSHNPTTTTVAPKVAVRTDKSTQQCNLNAPLVLLPNVQSGPFCYQDLLDVLKKCFF